MATGTAAAALTQVKGKPNFLQVIQDDDAIAQIEVPDVKRWKARVAKILDTLPWRSITPLDAKGGIVGPRVDNQEAESSTYYDENPLEDLAMPSEMRGFEAILGLFLKAQDVALVRQKQAYDSVLDNNQQLLKVISNRLESMEKHADRQFQTTAELHNRLNAASDDGDSDSALVASVAQMVMAQTQGKS